MTVLFFLSRMSKEKGQWDGFRKGETFVYEPRIAGSWLGNQGRQEHIDAKKIFEEKVNS